MLPLLIMMIALVGVAIGLVRTRPEPARRALPASIDASAPTRLSTATFGMG